MRSVTAASKPALKRKTHSPVVSWLKNAASCWQLYVLVLPAVVAVAVFNYLPMYGIQIAFKDFQPGDMGKPLGRPQAFHLIYYL